MEWLEMFILYMSIPSLPLGIPEGLIDRETIVSSHTTSGSKLGWMKKMLAYGDSVNPIN